MKTILGESYLFIFAFSCVVIIGAILAAWRKERTLHFDLTLAGADPEEVANFVYDEKNAKRLNPLIISFDVVDNDESMNSYSAKYAEHLPIFGTNNGYANYSMRKGVMEDGSFIITSHHTNCVLWDLYCTDSNSTMVFRKGEGNTALFTEQVTVHCPTVMETFCVDQTLENRMNWLKELRFLIYSLKYS